MKVLFVIGTRPEAIKVKPVIQEMLTNDFFEPLVASTGQQKDLLPEIIEALEIEPHFSPNSSLQKNGPADFVANSIIFLSDVIENSKPDVLLVHGDTSSALAGALSGFLKGVPVGHIEAGLRTNDLEAPYPEEGYRQMIARIANYNFAPTELSKQNLISEGVAESKILVTGNTIVDAVQSFRDSGRLSKTAALQGIKQGTNDPYCVVTLHRRENQGSRILRSLEIIERELGASGLKIFVVKHPNPKVLESLKTIENRSATISLVEPLQYFDFLSLISGADLLITDSGGIQEEAVTLGVQAFVVRDQTERPEGIETGMIRLVGNDSQDLAEALAGFLGNREPHKPKTSSFGNPYGDGKASKRISSFLAENRQ